MQQLGVDKGVLIIKVVPNSPASKADLQGTAGMRTAMSILATRLRPSTASRSRTAKTCTAGLDQCKVGETVTVTIVRDGKRQDVQVTLDASQ